MIWFCADTHFGHDNIRAYCDRPFASIEEHDAAIVNNWNTVVGKNDTVYHLGDLAFFRGRNKTNKLVDLCNSLNGKKYLILGNHDRGSNLYKLGINFDILGSYYDLKIQDPEMGKVTIVLCHYPIERWNKKHFGSLHLHGHCHGTLESKGIARMDVGVDSHEYFPISFEEIKIRFTQELMKKGM